MKSFQDNKGNKWLVDVNVASVKRVKALAGVDLMTVMEQGNGLFQRLATNPIALVDTVYAVCKPQADQQGVSDEQFGEAMAGDAIDNATVALLEAIADFFPQARRKVLMKVAEKVRAAEDLSATRIVSHLDRINLTKEVDRIMNEAQRELSGEPSSPPPASGNSSSSSPAAAASTPTHAPSES